MKASVLYTQEFNQAYKSLTEQELPISEVKKIVQIDKEINEVMQKISSYKDQLLADYKARQEEAEKMKAELEDETELMNKKLTVYANSIDFIPSMRLDSAVLMSVKLTAKSYANLIDFFE